MTFTFTEEEFKGATFLAFEMLVKAKKFGDMDDDEVNRCTKLCADFTKYIEFVLEDEALVQVGVKRMKNRRKK